MNKHQIREKCRAYAEQFVPHGLHWSENIMHVFYCGAVAFAGESLWVSFAAGTLGLILVLNMLIGGTNG